MNSAYNTIQMWDGRKTTLEDQALGPIGDPNEMALPIPQLVERLSAIDGYRPMFERAYLVSLVKSTRALRAQNGQVDARACV